MQDMKNKIRALSIFLIAMSALLIALEIIPYGIHIRWGFTTGEITPIDYSYFDLSLFFEQGIRAPLCTAVLSCVLLLLDVLAIAIQEKVFLFPIIIVNLLALIASVASFSWTVIGTIVCVLLLGELVVGFVGYRYIVSLKRGE